MLDKSVPQFLGLPAPILPGIVALMYIASILYPQKFQWSEEDLASTVTVNKRQAVVASDEQNTVVPGPPWSSTTKKAWVVLQWLHHSFTANTLFRISTGSKEPFTNVCLVQLALIGAESLILYTARRPWRQTELALLGTAWSGMLIQSMWSLAASGIILTSLLLTISILGVTSILTPAFNKPIVSETNIKNSSTEKTMSGALEDAQDAPPEQPNLTYIRFFSVSLLLIAILKGYSNVESLLSRTLPWSIPYRPFSIPFLLIFLQDAIVNWRATGQQRRAFGQHIRSFLSRARSCAPDYIYDGFVRPLISIGAIAALFLASSFLTSCLGFRRLILGRPPTPPSFDDGGIFGGSLYIFFACGNLLVKKNNLRRTRPHMLPFALVLIAAFGQTITFLVILISVLFGFTYA